MIKSVFGLPGEGKTTFLTKCARMWLSGKRYMGIPPSDRVFTSFYCPGCYKLDWNTLGLYDMQNSNILIDEIMLFCDNRNWKEFPEHLKAFFSLHRHWNINIIWCSQNWRDCDLKIRNLTQDFYLIQKSIIFPQISFIKPIVRKFGVQHDSIVDTYVLAAPLEWKFVYRPRYYSYFDTYAKHKVLPPVKLISWDDVEKGTGIPQAEPEPDPETAPGYKLTKSVYKKSES